MYNMYIVWFFLVYSHQPGLSFEQYKKNMGTEMTRVEKCRNSSIDLFDNFDVIWHPDMTTNNWYQTMWIDVKKVKIGSTAVYDVF
jgi:hypothetical protein